MLNIKVLMVPYNVSVTEIAETIDCTITTAGQKINGKTKTTTVEAFKIKDKHFPDKTIDYLFSEYQNDKRASNQ